MIPITVGHTSNLVASGDENGNIFLWKDIESIKENIGVNIQCHTSSLQRLEFTFDDKKLFSLGQQDQCVC